MASIRRITDADVCMFCGGLVVGSICVSCGMVQ